MAGKNPSLEEFTRSLQEELERVEEEVKKKYESKEFQEKLEEYVKRYISSAGLSKVLLVEFHLPSVDLRSKIVSVEEGGRKVVRVRGLDKKDLKKIASLRTIFFRNLRITGAFKIGERTWAILPGYERELVAKTNAILKELNEILKKYGFPPRTVDLVEMYAPIAWVVKKLSDTIREYQLDLQEVVRELENEELEEKKRKLLASKASLLKRILKSLERQLRELAGGLASSQEKHARKYLAFANTPEKATAKSDKEEESIEKRARKYLAI